MDDIVWWCDSAADARQTLALLRRQLWDRRRLRLKPNPQLGRSDAGLAFCGFRVRPGVVLPSQRKLQRFKAGAARLAQACLHGYGSDPAIACSQIQRALDGLQATLAHTQSLHFQQAVWARLGAWDGDDLPGRPDPLPLQWPP